MCDVSTELRCQERVRDAAMPIAEHPRPGAHAGDITSATDMRLILHSGGLVKYYFTISEPTARFSFCSNHLLLHLHAVQS
jgi:hypothetical protein